MWLEKPLEQFLAFRWASHCLALAFDHPLLPLFWQQLVVLAHARVPAAAAGGLSPAFGARLLSAKDGLIAAMRRRCVGARWAASAAVGGRP